MVTAVPESGLRDKALQAVNQLPPFSPTLNKLLASLAKENVFLSEIAAIIEKDTVLAGQVLKLVNSALYARSGTVNSVRHAVAILGLNKLRNLALSMSVTRMWKQVATPPTWSQASFNVHSVAVAIMADGLAQRINVSYPEGAFTAGLLHSVGKLLIAVGLPRQYVEILERHGAEPRTPFHDIETRVIGCSHTRLASGALEFWKLPGQIREAIQYQDDPRPDHNNLMDLSRMLWNAHKAVSISGICIPSCGLSSEGTLEELFDGLGLRDQKDRIMDDFQKEFDTIRSFF